MSAGSGEGAKPGQSGTNQQARNVADSGETPKGVVRG